MNDTKPAGGIPNEDIRKISVKEGVSAEFLTELVAFHTRKMRSGASPRIVEVCRQYCRCRIPFLWQWCMLPDTILLLKAD